MTVETPTRTDTPEAGHRRQKPVLSDGARAERRLGLLLISPAVVVLLAVTAYPIVDAIYLSLRRSDLRFPAESKFIGFANYATVLESKYWWQSLGVTAIITVVGVAIEFVLGFALAMLMHRTLFARGAVRTFVLIPYGIVTVVAAFSWQFAWTPSEGYLSAAFGNSAPLTHQGTALTVIILAEVWKTTPAIALLLMAGLSLVPEDLQNAARMDGASAWQRFIKITVPLMKPAILVAVLFRALDAFRVFDNIFILTAGSHNTGSVSILGYDNLFTALNLGVGSAISILIFLITAVIAFVFIKAFGTAVPGTES